MRRPLPFCAAALSLLLTACTQDVYEKGQGSYSLLRGDLVEAHAGADNRIDRIITDDGDTLAPVTPMAHEWGQTPDTTYRALCYYNLTETRQADIVSCRPIATDTLTPRSELKNGMKTDPVKLESIWIGKTRRYLNVSMYLKTGQTDDPKARHRIGFVSDTLLTNADATKTLHLQLYHDQGGIPEYYFSNRTYISIPLYQLKADSISLSIQTYDGRVEKRFRLQP